MCYGSIIISQANKSDSLAKKPKKRKKKEKPANLWETHHTTTN
jgi:hypothetical protein